MNNHADEGTNNDCRIDLDHRTVALPVSNIATQRLINTPHELLKKHLRELVPLECGMKQQPLEFRIAFVMLECAECQSFENRAVILFLKRLGNHLLRIHGIS